MLKFINCIKLTSTSLLSITMASALASQPASANNVPVKIDSLNTTRVSATSSNGNVCDASGANCVTKNYGTGTNIKLNGFKVGQNNYSILKLVDEAKFQRVNNNQVQGQRHIYFLETGSNNSIGSSSIFTMENAVRSNFINGGTDNVFANTGGVNLNNIERVDFLIKSGLIVKQEYVNDAGFLLLERGGNDPFKIAAITGIDANGNPSSFGNLINVPTSTWGDSGINILTSVFQNQSNWNAPKLTGSLTGQNIKGIFVSINSLGVATGQTVYGYALFPGDITSSNNLVTLNDFPQNTSADSGQGGLDLISSGGLFIPEGVPESAVFKPALAVNDIVTTNEDTSVNGNVLTNDDGDSPIVTSTGQIILASGAVVNINSDGTFSYNPNSKFESLNTGDTKTDSFNYTMRDGSGNVSSATVTMNISGAADNPNAVDDSSATDEDTGNTIHVLSNDTDPNRDSLTVTMINGVTASVGSSVRINSGALVTLNANGTLSYNPNYSFESLNDNQTDTDTFDYTVNDGHGNTDSGTVTMTIEGITDSSD